ncbi:putative spermidine/putrescine transport system ATP-binding protein [Pseudomonas flavescens]|uniref:Putative spermidine/putrescine transport system ATP-binding protein n=1 Tax=Phytopseudomonas flavescens TaxID=29435 RepID=A0A1G8LYW5_9GAMM|nr:ABC transporter ATP-binding protein [Pseudomonas flavescens]SDI60835.1 putative spermidine/putrescine transport system ATP-binding protein [Pseudomonas flavescens]
MSGKGQVELVAVHKAYGARVAVTDLHLKIPSGSYCCLLGPSGCGKSTTLRMLAGHEAVSEGDILMDNRNVTAFSPTQRGTAMMFQNYALFPHMSCLDNVAFGLRIAGMAKAERHAKARELLALVNMQDYAESYPEQLSGGQQQRVALARALITQPDVVLLDEPLSALDPFLRIRMRKELKAIQKQLGLTFIHVTHSQEEAFALADLAVVMDAGKIQQVAPPRELFERPATPFVAQFIGGHSLMRGELTAREADRVVLSVEGAGQGNLSLAQLGDDYAEALVGTPLAFSVRCDHLDLLPPGSVPPAGRFGLPARVCDVEFQGAFIYVECQTASATPLMVYLADRQRQVPEVGAEVTLAWDAAHLNLFSPQHANPTEEVH